MCKQDVITQFLADIYHCCDMWGQTTTAQEMETNIKEWTLCGIDCPFPDPVLYAEIWNNFAKMYK